MPFLQSSVLIPLSSRWVPCTRLYASPQRACTPSGDSGLPIMKCSVKTIGTYTNTPGLIQLVYIIAFFSPVFKRKKARGPFFAKWLKKFHALFSGFLYHFFAFNFNCSSSSCASLTAPGASVSRQLALAVFGNAIVSRRLLRPARSMTIRSRPSAMPPCGGVP